MMTDDARRGERGRGAGESSAAGRPASGPIGETEADEFAGDVAAAGDRDPHAPDHGPDIPGAAGGGTGIGDLAGGTGIGTDDAGGDTGEPGDGGR